MVNHNHDDSGRFAPKKVLVKNGKAATLFKVGNPGGPGRHSLPFKLAEMLDRCITVEDWEAMWRNMVEVAKSKGRDRVAAASFLTERRFGKAPQSIDVTSGGKELHILIPGLMNGDSNQSP